MASVLSPMSGGEHFKPAAGRTKPTPLYMAKLDQRTRMAFQVTVANVCASRRSGRQQRRDSADSHRQLRGRLVRWPKWPTSFDGSTAKSLTRATRWRPQVIHLLAQNHPTTALKTVPINPSTA